MMPNADNDFLLGLAGVSGTMLGTFIVGVFFYIDSEMHRRLAASEAADRYFRSSIRWVFTAYSIPLLVPLALASLDALWGALSFIALGILLVAMTVETGRRILARGGAGSSRSLVVNEWASSFGIVIAMVLPWTLGGWVPAPDDFVPSLLILLACGFASTAALVMTQFDATMGMVDAGMRDRDGAEPDDPADR
ncbi:MULTISPECIES: hypothetical protein [Micrococcales]|jgi:hypothetical protein|uniref:DUF2975 domain-containing protein n=4 Tax=Actinomycetes TaxID=1760 RepID=A0ABU8LKN9_9MICO|nr:MULTISPECIES: hypothetical protein [Micrococcales]MCG7413277.1 hypothetical protein [Microbacterium aurum]MCT1431859.1 hypothetical protein [Brachybacterium muris]MCT1479869.1 hypothetical protein [Microbacterium sp. p3-SID336]MCV7563554.1 hypothetical protein [Micrococcus luteus]MCV7613782.1 hypothetical protein [Micrococcus luteus]